LPGAQFDEQSLGLDAQRLWVMEGATNEEFAAFLTETHACDLNSGPIGLMAPYLELVSALIG
jgi:hypothetical protein